MNNKRNNIHLLAMLVVSGMTLPAWADGEYFDNAQVLSATPQVQQVNTPRQECKTEYVQEPYTEHSTAGAIVGGIAGGLLGSQVGKGSGQVAAAAVGAGVGAVVGDRVGSTTSYPARPVQRCYNVDNWQTVTTGYLVTYRYNGRDYTTVTDQPPGNTIRVRVAVGVSAPAQAAPVIINQAPPVYSAPVTTVYHEYYPRPAPVVVVPSFGFDYYRGVGPWWHGGPGGPHRW